MSSLLISYFAGVLGGASVLLVYLAISTWWVDHKRSAAMWDYLNRQAQQSSGPGRVAEKQ